jgi:hypothetical protein
MSINLNKTSDSLSFSSLTIRAGDLDELLNLILGGALSQFKRGVIAQLD